MFNFAKEKSWSVKLLSGFISNNQVRSDKCKGCASSTQLIVGNNDDPNLALWGCNGHKCKHILIRMKFEPQNFAEIVAFSQPVTDIEISSANLAFKRG